MDGMGWEEWHLRTSEDIVKADWHRGMRLLALAHRKLAGTRKDYCPGRLTEDLHWKKHPMKRVLIQDLLFPKPRQLHHCESDSNRSKYGLWSYVPTLEYRIVVLVALARYENAFPGWL